MNSDTAIGGSYWLEVALKDGIPAMAPEEMAYVPEYVPNE